MKRRGGVFVLTLVAVAALTTILAVMASQVNVSAQQTRNRMEARRALLLCDSAAERALAAIATLTEFQRITQQDDWYALGTQGDDNFLVGDGSFRVQILDAAGQINLNTAPQAQLEALGLTAEQVDSLLDWREAGNFPRPQGAKDEYYNALPTPYNARLGRLETFEELLLVKGFTPSLLYQPLSQVGSQTFSSGNGDQSLYQLAGVDAFSPNLNPDGQNRTNLNTAQVGQLIQAGLTPQVAAALVARRGGGFTNLGVALQTPGLDNRQAGVLLDRFAIGTAARREGLINVNTAPEEVLLTVPGITSDIASGIVSRQSTGGFAALSELTQIPGITVAVLQQAADRLTVTSDTFVVRVIATAGSTRKAREYVIRIEESAPRIVKRMDAYQDDMRTPWAWSEDPTRDEDLGEATE